MVYQDDYEKEPIGGGNPYYRCIHCKIAAPQINGSIEGHLADCYYRLGKERATVQMSQNVKQAATEEGVAQALLPNSARWNRINTGPTHLTVEDALAQNDAWQLNPAVRPSLELSRNVASTLAAEVKRLQDLVARAKKESELVEYHGRAALIVPYWFMKS